MGISKNLEFKKKSKSQKSEHYMMHGTEIGNKKGFQSPLANMAIPLLELPKSLAKEGITSGRI